MWLYLSISAAVAVTGLISWYLKVPTCNEIALSARHTMTIIAELYKIIRRNGLGVCLIWTNKVFANWLGKRLIEIHHRHYIIHYPYGVTWYKIIVPRKRSPCKVDSICDENAVNVKKNVMSFMGPSYNFHGISITPKMLGYTKLTFTLLNGDIKTFGENDTIIV